MLPVLSVVCIAGHALNGVAATASGWQLNDRRRDAFIEGYRVKAAVIVVGQGGAHH